MKMMFNTNASKGEKIPATSTRCFDILPNLSSVPPRSVRLGSVLGSKSNKKVYTTISKILDQPAKVWFRELKHEAPANSRRTRN
jgi:hypothetical protein